MMRSFFFLFCALFFLGAAVSLAKLRSLYSSLDPTSVREHLAYYQLYGDSPFGQKALQEALALLSGKEAISSMHHVPLLPVEQVDSIISLVHPLLSSQSSPLTKEQIEWVQQMSARLPHNQLRGHKMVTEEEVLSLAPEEMDLARALLIALDDPNKESYEARLDLMALQILSRTSLSASPEEKIRAINRFVFEEVGFKFPPHSLYAKDVDKYTFLPSVIDSQRGICLGVSILYVCLAQRMGLSLEMVTPPGHIYVRYCEEGQTINIETTARGIHLDTEYYLGIDTRALEERNLKEMVGLAFFNQAALYWQEEEHEKALEAYYRAEKYLPQDILVQEFLAYQLLFLGKEEEGRSRLEAIVDQIPESNVTKNMVIEDYLEGKTDAEGIRVLFLHVDETRDSILEKKKKIESALDRYPTFRAGLFHLAIAWLQLHREREATEMLLRYHALDPNHPVVEYFLAQLFLQRLHYPAAWAHYCSCKEITAKKNHFPKALRDLDREFRVRCLALQTEGDDYE